MDVYEMLRELRAERERLDKLIKQFELLGHNGDEQRSKLNGTVRDKPGHKAAPKKSS